MHYYVYMVKHSISTKRFTMKSKFSFHPRLRVSFPTSNKQFYVFSCLCRNFLCMCLLTFFAYIEALSCSIYQCFMVIFPCQVMQIWLILLKILKITEYSIVCSLYEYHIIDETILHLIDILIFSLLQFIKTGSIIFSEHFCACNLAIRMSISISAEYILRGKLLAQRICPFLILIDISKLSSIEIYQILVPSLVRTLHLYFFNSWHCKINTKYIPFIKFI